MNFSNLNNGNHGQEYCSNDIGIALSRINADNQSMGFLHGRNNGSSVFVQASGSNSGLGFQENGKIGDEELSDEEICKFFTCTGTLSKNRTDDSRIDGRRGRKGFMNRRMNLHSNGLYTDHKPSTGFTFERPSNPMAHSLMHSFDGGGADCSASNSSVPLFMHESKSGEEDRFISMQPREDFCRTFLPFSTHYQQTESSSLKRQVAVSASLNEDTMNPLLLMGNNSLADGMNSYNAVLNNEQHHAMYGFAPKRLKYETSSNPSFLGS